MKRRVTLSREEKDFYAGFISEDSPEKIRARHALRLAVDIRSFMRGLPGDVQDRLHNAAYALEEWAEKQR